MKWDDKKRLEIEIDAWLDGIAIMEPQMAPVGFEQRVMEAIRRHEKADGNPVKRMVGSWKSVAAGIAVLLAMNLYTALSIKKAEPAVDTSVQTATVYDASVDRDTYNNYSLLVMDDSK